MATNLPLLLFLIFCYVASVMAWHNCRGVGNSDIKMWKPDDGMVPIASGNVRFEGDDIRPAFLDGAQGFRVYPWEPQDDWRTTFQLGPKAGNKYNMVRINSSHDGKDYTDYIWLNQGQICDMKDIAFHNIKAVQVKSWNHEVWHG